MKKKLSFLLICVLILPVLFLSVHATFPYGYNEIQKNGWYRTPVNPEYQVVVPKVDRTIKVHDLANLLTGEETAELQRLSQSYQDRYFMDCVFVTTDNAQGLSAVEYADDFFHYNGFGFSGGTEPEQINGILFLIDMDNREFYVSTQSMAIRVYDDPSIESILDDAFKHMPDGRYGQAFVSAFKRAETIASREFSRVERTETGQREINQYLNASYEVAPVPPFRITKQLLLIALAVAGGGTLAVIGIMLGAHRNTLSAPPIATAYTGREGVQTYHRQDILVNTHTSRTKIPEPSSSSGSSGGGFGGGGSSHSSSSGSSSGGGGRGF